VFQPPGSVLTWICGNVAERSKKLVILPFVTSKAEWLENEWNYGGADVLHERLGVNADI